MEEIKNDVRRFLQREFYLENKSDELKARMQDAAAKFVYDKYPHVKRCVIDFNWFGEIEIDIA